ncbi:hypothetical protein VTN00DRAFT_5596 [Thermoascus crustaceus]|uniref:uncharacterized protein n=1 Tax=Thermoascus crustaceus TaxID=5088 RepID=UPI00374451DE
MGLIEKLQAKIELYRLEQRYTRRKHRTTFHSCAQYVDGEYVYNTHSPTSPTGTVSKHATGGSDYWRPPGWGGPGPKDSRYR